MKDHNNPSFLQLEMEMTRMEMNQNKAQRIMDDIYDDYFYRTEIDLQRMKIEYQRLCEYMEIAQDYVRSSREEMERAKDTLYKLWPTDKGAEGGDTLEPKKE